MLLTDLLGIELKSKDIVLVGKPEESGILSSDGEPYFIFQLKTPVTVRCSVDKTIEPFQTGEVYVRESAVKSDKWLLVDPKKPKEGFYMKDWKVDFSKGQEVVLYQETTIQKWARSNRGSRRTENAISINERIKARQAERAKNGK